MTDSLRSPRRQIHTAVALTLFCGLAAACNEHTEPVPLGDAEVRVSQQRVALTPKTPAPAHAVRPDTAKSHADESVKAQRVLAPEELAAQRGTSGEETREVEVSGTPTTLFIKRLVVTKEVHDREPQPAQQLVAEDGPVIAFVELANTAEAPQSVVVTFEHQAAPKSVGHVKLNIPGKMKRWRTWAKTHNVTEPGTWDAVVSSTDGVELARKSFEVAG